MVESWKQELDKNIIQTSNRVKYDKPFKVLFDHWGATTKIPPSNIIFPLKFGIWV